MKLIMVTVVMALTLLNSPNVIAADKIDLKSVLTEVESSQPMDAWGDPDSGLAWINKTTKTLHVDLYSDPCHTLLPPHQGYIGCLAIARITASFAVPLQSIKESTCDRIVYSGKAVVDTIIGPGGKQTGEIEIQISDNRLFGEGCKSYLPMPKVSGFLNVRVEGIPENNIRFAGVVLENDDKFFE